MIRGELPSEPLLAVLPRIAAEQATGVLHLQRTGLVGEEGHVFIQSGQVYAASAGHERMPIETRLMFSHGLSAQALSTALDAQAGALTGWRIGEILVHLGFVDQATVEAASREQVLDALTDMSTWSEGNWRFVMNDRTRTMLSTALPWTELEPLIRIRMTEWTELLPVIHGAHAVPLPVAVGMGTDGLDQPTAELLSHVDGVRTVTEVAHDRGLSVLETGRMLAGLSAAGAVEIGGADLPANARELLEALRHLPDPPEDPMAAVLDLDAAREARAADESARALARREADDRELAEAARRSAEAAAQERFLAEQAVAEELAQQLKAEAQARADAATAQRLAQEHVQQQAQQLRSAILDAERAAQLAAEAQSLDAELSLADALRSVNSPNPDTDTDTDELAAALSAAWVIPTESVEPAPAELEVTMDISTEVQFVEFTSSEEPVFEPVDEVTDDATQVLPVYVPRIPIQPTAGADMASFFRELSSLGENEPTPFTPPRVASSRPPGAGDPKGKKKKGLFGR